MAAAKADQRPNKEFNQIIQVGLKAHQLGTQYPPNLVGRLGVDLLANLGADLGLLGTVVPAARGAHEDAQQTTAAQGSALLAGHAFVTATRTAVARKKPSKDVAKAYGIGGRLNKNVVKDVKGALQRIVDRASANPVEAQGFGILPADVALMQKQIEAIEAADAAQEAARAKAPLSTKQRNVVARRILDAVDSIAGAGVLAFATSPTERAHFEALIRKG